MSPTISPAESFENFTLHPEQTLESLRTSGEPLELVAKGGQVVVIQDAAHYRKMLAELDRLETIAALKQSFRDTAEGRTMPVREAFAELARKHSLPPIEERKR